MTLHPSKHTPVGLASGLVNHVRCEETAKQQRHQRDHDRAPDELSGGELPSDQDREDDPELEDEVGRAELERHRAGEVGALTKQRARERDGGIGARRGGSTEPGGDHQGAR